MKKENLHFEAQVVSEIKAGKMELFITAVPDLNSLKRFLLRSRSLTRY